MSPSSSSSGSLCLIWNLEDARHEWVAIVGRLFEQFEGDTPQYRRGTWKRVWEEQSSLPEGDPKKVFKDAIHEQFTNYAKNHTLEVRVLN